MATNIGVGMAQFDDNFLTVLRNGIDRLCQDHAGVTLQVEDGANDLNKQLSEIQNFVASKVDAIIVNPVDTDATAAITKLAADANIPLVYVNRQPVNLNSLPANQAFVGVQREGFRHARDPAGLQGLSRTPARAPAPTST